MEPKNFDLRGEINGLRKTADSDKWVEEEKDRQGDIDLGWAYYDSTLSSFDENFKETLPAGFNDINEYIEQTYLKKKGQLIGVELGGPANNLFSSLPTHYFKKTAGFTLHKRNQDVSINSTHEILEADVFSKRTPGSDTPGYQKIEQWAEEHGGIDILFERMVLPLKYPNSDHLLLIIKRWYRLLSNEGTAFISLPKNYEYRDDIVSFFRANEKFFDFQIKEMRDSTNEEQNGIFIRLRKLNGAPDSLDELLKK